MISDAVAETVKSVTTGGAIAALPWITFLDDFLRYTGTVMGIVYAGVMIYIAVQRYRAGKSDLS